MARNHRWAPVWAVKVPTLVDQSGCMWPSGTKVYEAAALQEVESELRAQIETALAAGVDVTHLDSHMFVLHGQRSEFRRIYLGLANEYRLPVRAVRRGLLVPLSLKWTISKPRLMLRLVRRALRLRGFFARMLGELTDLDIQCPDYLVFAGPPRLFDEPANYWRQVVNLLPSGVTEIYCHLARLTTETVADVRDIHEREADWEFFVSPQTPTLFEQAGVNLISYRPLREQMRAPGRTE